MLSRLKPLLSTFTFRLALVYVGLFSMSVVLLFGFIFTFATRYLEAQVADSVRVRYNILINEYRENGSSGLESRIRELIDSDDEGAEIYLLVNNRNERMAGNLNEWPERATQEGAFDKDGEWIRFRIEGSRNHPGSIAVRAVTVPLSKWRSLLVGQSMQNSRKVEQIIIQTFWASLALTLVMAFIGAVVMTRSVMRRLAIINRSADTIMHGELSTRIPFTRGGDEFDELSHNLNRMLDRIEMLMESLSQFANNIAHDLRSPLNRIVARTEAGLRGMRETSAARRLLEKNVEEMQELIGTFNSILKISELEANTDVRTFEPCDVSLVLHRLIDFYEPYAAEKNIRFKANIPARLMVHGEQNLLSQAFANLLDNAIKFSPEGEIITVSAQAADGITAITVADKGPGIPDEYRERVFEKFFRLESSRNTKGNGLGLSLVAAVAHIHGARITLENNAPGLSVNILFPET